MTKIGFLIPSTNRGLVCKTFKETPFYNLFLVSFLKTRSLDYEFKIYLVVDDDDPIYGNKNEMLAIKTFINSLEKVSIQVISSHGIQKGYVTAMWNRAFEVAYNDKCDYFYQVGDDIEIMDEGWEDVFIKQLKDLDDIGMAGPFDYGRYLWEVNNKTRQKFILTQSFVGRSHYDIFGFYFNPRIKNWFCDDWITKLYFKVERAFFTPQLRIWNKGGAPRYVPPTAGAGMKRMNKLCNVLVNLDILKLNVAIQNSSCES